MEDIILTKEEALEWLSDGHSVISPELARKICEKIGVAFHDSLIKKFKSDPPGTFKGLTMQSEFENEEGVDCLSLSAYVAEQLGVAKNVPAFYGRGRQARAYAEQIGILLKK